MGIITVLPGDVGADWAYLGIKTPATFATHNVTFCTRYITRGTSTKALRPAERDMLLAAGVAITLCWETSTTAAFSGAPQGRLDGLDAARAAALIGYPAGLPIWCAVDTDVVASNSLLVREYLRAFYANCSPYARGLYGDEDAYALVAELDPAWCLPNALGWSPRLRLWFAGILKIFGFGFKGHIRQGREDTALGWDFPNKCTKAFPAWAAAPTPPAVIPRESPTPIPMPLLEDDMSNVLYVSDPTAPAAEQFAAQFFAVANADGAALEVRWTGPDSPKVRDRIAAHKAKGLKVVPVRRAGLINCTLKGPIPDGFTAADFADVD